MQKRYQVFISSTYTDLKEERGHVSQILMQMECIPAGMELFPATDEEQFEFIKKVIDDSDYYLLIIGGRYGSLTNEGVSYTEKEFEYALSKEIPIVALLHENSSSLPMAKSELGQDMRDRLEAFRKRASKGRLVKFWNNSEQLGAQVAISMTATISRFPRVGWIRGSNVASEELLQEINDLRKINDSLKKNSLSNGPIEHFDINPAELSTNFSIHGTYFEHNGTHSWKAIITWEKIFYLISPYLIKPTPEEFIKNALHKDVLDDYGIRRFRNTMRDQDFQTIAVQVMALGLVSIEVPAVAGLQAIWRLTAKGEALMYKLRVRTN